MNIENMMEIVFQVKIKDIIIVNTIFGVLTDVSNESLTVMLQNNKFIVISTKYLLEINDWKEYDQIE